MAAKKMLLLPPILLQRLLQAAVQRMLQAVLPYCYALDEAVPALR